MKQSPLGFTAGTNIGFQMTQQLYSILANNFQGDSSIDFVQIILNIKKEIFELEKAEKILSDNYQNLPALIPNDKPTFNLLKFVNSETGESNNIFFMCMPEGAGSSIKVKDRMLYASSKSGLIGQLKGEGLDIVLDQKYTMEINDGEEVGLAELNKLTAPAQQESSGFVKKVARPGRGPARRPKRNEE